MSFKVFVYYCALCGGWAAFLTWAVVYATGITNLEPTAGGSYWLRAGLTGAVLGTLIAGAIGAVDAVLNAVGFQRGLRVLLCLGVGLVGGLFGGVVGQLLNEVLRVPVFVGWMLAGSLIGGSIGVFDLLRAFLGNHDIRAALKKTLNGVLGGVLGGLLGGVPFTFLVGGDTTLKSSLTVNLVILGMCIGLLVGLAQVILKDAWLRVESGFRAGRELLLTKDVTTIGRAESSDLGLFGDNAIEKTHARILLKNNRYLLEDADTEAGTFVNDRPVGAKPVPLRKGDLIRVGRSVLRFGERQKRK
jgi:hypothetical protein